MKDLEALIVEIDGHITGPDPCPKITHLSRSYSPSVQAGGVGGLLNAFWEFEF
jgi:hypothetical protein